MQNTLGTILAYLLFIGMLCGLVAGSLSLFGYSITHNIICIFLTLWIIAKCSEG